MIRRLNILFAVQFLISTVVFATGSNDEQPTSNDFEFSSEMIQNVAANKGAESAKISWGLNHEAYKNLKERNAKLIITYNTKIGKNRAKKNIDGGEWMYTEAIDLDEISFEIEDLIGNETYYFKVGFALEGDINEVKDDKSKMLWSDEAKVKTERGWGIAKLLILIGALGFFIFGMKLMSEGLQQAAGNRLRSMLGSITSNSVKGVFTGFGITSIVQSSSVTSVMTVSFVNAGLMTLRQSAGVMMGANVGTTITAWLVLLLGFKVSISSFAFMIIALATPLFFIQRGKAKAWANAILGFCILFIGLEALKDAVPMLDSNSGIVQFFIDFKDVWYGRLMFVLLGTLVTIIIQSSSAAMALTLTLVAAGSIPFEVACAMILGENIGTTITAQIASLIANVHAKRSAYIHTMFNLIGVIWMILIFPYFIEMIGYFVAGSNFDPLNTEMANSGIALFHTLFNIANVLLLIWFVPQLVRIAVKAVKSKGEADEEFKLDFIDGPLGSTAELCILEATKEVAKFGKLTSKMNGFVKTHINSSDKKEKNKMLTKIEKYEEITDRVEVEIADYLGQTARLEMSDEASSQMRGMLNITTDLERIGDIYFQMSKVLEKKDSDKNYFTPEQRDGINKMIALTEEAFEIMNENLKCEYGSIAMDKANAKEKEINSFRDYLRRKHIENIEQNDFNMNNALIYTNIFASFEKVGDHIINVSEAVAGEI
jgi:phosphate:Na+ symporter